MPKIRHDFFLISCFSGHFGPDRLFVFLFLALRSPTVYQPELHQQLVKIEPIGLTEGGADTI